MSPEESQASSDNASGDEQLSDHEQRKLVCRPLPWRSAKAKKVLAALDKKYKKTAVRERNVNDCPQSCRTSFNAEAAKTGHTRMGIGLLGSGRF